MMKLLLSATLLTNIADVELFYPTIFYFLWGVNDSTRDWQNLIQVKVSSNCIWIAVLVPPK